MPLEEGGGGQLHHRDTFTAPFHLQIKRASEPAGLCWALSCLVKLDGSELEGEAGDEVEDCEAKRQNQVLRVYNMAPKCHEESWQWTRAAGWNQIQVPRWAGQGVSQDRVAPCAA